MIQHGEQEQLVELKSRGELQSGNGGESKMASKHADDQKRVHTDLPSHLPDAVDELDEERRALGVGVVLIAVTHPL